MKRCFAVIVDAEAPAERLAMFRVLTGVFSVGYLAVRLPVFLALGDRSSSTFDGVGVLGGLESPVSENVVDVLVIGTLLLGIGYASGTLFRLTGPAFGVGMLLLTTYRGSFGQLLHFENLLVLHVLIVALSPATDAWSVDNAMQRRRSSGASRPRSATAYGWPLAVAGLVVVSSYMISAIAKLRYGGAEWVMGDTLRNHIAYSAARLELLGGRPSPFARYAVRHGWIFPPLALGAIALELAAPLAFVRERLRNVWVAGIWTMHVSILASMLIVFPYPLFVVAFAPFFRLERLVEVALRS